MNNQPKTILLDCDVVSHFITNNCLSDLFIILAPIAQQTTYTILAL